MDTKSFLTSKTLWGLLIAALAPLLAQHGITIDQDGLTNDLIGLVGLGVGIYGRFSATQGLHVVAPASNKQAGFSTVPMLLVLSALALLVACSSTPARLAYDADLTADQAYKAIPGLLKDHAISADTAQKIVLACDAVQSAASVVQVCTAANSDSSQCSTAALTAALSKLAVLVPTGAVQ